MMESIKPLPEKLRSSIRSGFIISDMIRVVEELVYNSLDAGATKVFISVGVGTGYVKVEDNGCGINRDGLVLLGERYATSKHETKSETCRGLRSFGNRGEVLRSIADVSLLEIITKAKGRLNGYRKVMKGSSCVHLGIDNDIWDAGTTVIVHDLFYNQPVRITHMLSSPKKILHSVKKCVLQIALVRPQVIFSIVDIESEGEFLHTHASSSPLALLVSHYGIKVAHLHELSLSEGPFELAGYVSNSPKSFSMKGIQHIYVNSRFIDKSPIHKLVNGLASTFFEQLNNSQGGKRGRPQACATYCLNITCSLSLYELNIEQSKTLVEFKDWLSLLSFIEKSVASLWTSTSSTGQLYSPTAEPTSRHYNGKEADIIVSTDIDADFLDTIEIPKKRRKIQKNLSPQPDLNSSLSPRVNLEGGMYGMFPSRQYNPSDFGYFPIMDCTDHPWNITDKLTTIGEDRYSSFIKRDGSSAHDSFSSEEMAESPVRIMPGYERNYTEVNPKILHPCQFEDDKRLHRQILSSVESANCAFFHKGSSLENLHAVPLNSKDQEDFMEDMFATRKYDTFQEDPVSSQEMDEPKLTHYPPSALQDVNGCLLRNCTSRKDPNEFIGEVWSELRSDDEIHRVDSMSPYNVNENLDEFQRTMWNNVSIPFSGSEVESERSEFPLLSDQEYATAGREKCHLVQEFGRFNADFQSSYSECEDMISDSIFGVNSLDFEHESLQEEGEKARSRNRANFKHFNQEKEDFHSCEFDDEFTNEDYLFNGHSSSHMRNTHGSSDKDAEDSHLYIRHCSHKLSPSRSTISFRERNLEFDDEFTNEDYFFSGDSSSRMRYAHESGDRDADDSLFYTRRCSRKLSPSRSTVTCRERNLESSSLYEGPPISAEGVPRAHQTRSGIKHRTFDKVRRKRSHSAPPIYIGKKRFLPLHASSNTILADTGKKIHTDNQEAKKKVLQNIGPKMIESLYSRDVAKTQNKKKLDSTGHSYDSSKINNEKFIQYSSTQLYKFPETSPVAELHHGRKMKEAVNMPDVTMIQNEVKLDSPLQDATDLGVKWRNGCPQEGSDDLQNHQIRGKSTNCQDKFPILNVSSGILHLSSDTIVPKSINRNCLEASKILAQVDKKFIPVVAGKILAFIDQHAADERIRLEDLRQKVLSGKMKTIAYLEEEKEMMLPETVYQLLHNYSDQIKHWGWICNIFQDSQSFSKNLNVLNKQPGAIRLLAVPCILGVNLSDNDLLEFVKQLEETDGSSTVPPSVLRILNYKSCRGAIMFGDTLLPSECSLIIEELKKTSLCFQCAHGRPTMAPLVNFEALHRQIDKLGLSKHDSSKMWHGLQRQPISLERAKKRLGISA